MVGNCAECWGMVEKGGKLWGLCGMEGNGEEFFGIGGVAWNCVEW